MNKRMMTAAVIAGAGAITVVILTDKTKSYTKAQAYGIGAAIPALAFLATRQVV